MLPFPRWWRREAQQSSRDGHRRPRDPSRFRPLRLESLEDRRLLAYTVSFNPNDGYLIIAKASGDTAALVASESDSNLNITDPGGTTFSSGTITGATGVTVSSTGVTINESATNVAHITYDFTSGTSSSLDNITFASMASPIQGFDVLGVAGSHDAVVFAGALTTSSSLPTSGGSATTASITLNVPYVDINGPNVAIATAATATDAPGDVDFSNSQIYAQTAGNNLAIDTSPAGATGAVNGGVVALNALSNNSGNQYVDNLSITTAGTGGEINFSTTASVTTDGTQTYNGPVVVGDIATLTSHGTGANGNVTFDSTVDGVEGDQALYVATAGLTDFKGAVGSSSTFATLEQLDVETGATLIEGGSVSTTVAQIYSGAVSITQNTTFTSNGGNIDSMPFDPVVPISLPGYPVPYSANITFGSTLGSTGGVYSVTVSTAGTTIFGGVVGGYLSAPTLDNLDITGGPTQIAGGEVTTTTAQTYNGVVTLTQNTTFNSTGVFADVPGQTYERLTSGGNIDFNSTLDGSGGIYSLTVYDPLETLTFGGAVGGSTGLPDISTINVLASNTLIDGGAVRTAGYQQFFNITLGANTTLASTGDASLNLKPMIDLENVDGAFNLIAESDGGINLGGVIGGNVPLASLTSEGYSNPAAGASQIDGNVTTSGSQTYNNLVLLGQPPMLMVDVLAPGQQSPVPPGTDTLTSTAGNLTFSSTVGGGENLVTSSSGTTTFNALVSIYSLTTGGSGSAITQFNTGTVTTVGPQVYNSPVLLVNNPVLSSNQSSITFNSTVGGNSALTTNSSSTTTFDALVSIASLSTGNFGGGATVDINTDTINTVGSQTYNAPVLLYDNPALTMQSPLQSGQNGQLPTGPALVLAVSHPFLTSSQGNITFNSTIGGNNGLYTSSPGTTTFNALVSIAELETSTFGVTQINTGTINTVSTQIYNSPVVLANNPDLTSSQGNITFNSTVGGNSNLTINGVGAGFYALVSIAGLTINDSSGTTYLGGGTISTTNAQTYNGAVALASNNTLTSAAGGNFTFTSTVSPSGSSTRTLTLNTTGKVNFAVPPSQGVTVVRGS